MKLFREIAGGILDLVYPRICAGCANQLYQAEEILCFSCLQNLPYTHFELIADNPVERTFWGRLPIVTAFSALYFTKNSMVQHLLHQLKYAGRKDLGVFLGKLMGQQMKQSSRLGDFDYLVALPLFASRERKRGYNQAAVLCEGIQEETGIPFLAHAVKRISATNTQTRMSRLERWQNMEGRFQVTQKDQLAGKSVLLIDDVLTTGATLEACGRELASLEGTRLSIATLAYTSKT